MFVGTGVEHAAFKHLTVRLAEGECLQLLGTARVGRVVFHDGSRPVMQLASHAVIGGDIAILTLAGGSLSRLVQSAGDALIRLVAESTRGFGYQ